MVCREESTWEPLVMEFQWKLCWAQDRHGKWSRCFLKCISKTNLLSLHLPLPPNTCQKHTLKECPGVELQSSNSNFFQTRACVLLLHRMWALMISWFWTAPDGKGQSVLNSCPAWKQFCQRQSPNTDDPYIFSHGTEVKCHPALRMSVRPAQGPWHSLSSHDLLQNKD